VAAQLADSQEKLNFMDFIDWLVKGYLKERKKTHGLI
jgi:hypothetical protein